MQKTFGLWALLIIVSGLLTGCGAGGSADAGSASADMPANSMASTPSDNAAARLASQTTTDPSLTKAAQPQRAVIRNGSLSIRVPDVEKTEKEVNKYVASIGGFVSSSDSTDLSSTAPQITMNLRVPVSQFDASMEMFEGKGVRLEKRISGEDVTAKLVDFDARLKIMEAQESSFRNMLAKSSNSKDALDLQTRLMNLRGDIESLSAQRKTLSELASLSTIDLTLVSETKSAAAAVADDGWFGESWNQATGAVTIAFRGVATILLFAAVFSPFWAPFAYLLWRRSHRAKVKPSFEM